MNRVSATGVAAILLRSRAMRAVLSAFVVATLTVGCSCEDDEPAQANPPQPSSSAEPTVPVAPMQAEAVTFQAEDGVALAGDLYASTEPEAPAVVLVHTFRADRSEWKPFVDVLARSAKRPTVLTFDLRGHGGSKSQGDAAGPADWSTMDKDDLTLFLDDIAAAVKYVDRGGRAKSIVLVGSSLGAALVATAAHRLPKVVALGLVSPGAAIEGFSVYEPFAEVREKRAFIAGAAADTVSREPVAALGKMAKNGTVKVYRGQAHAARWLGKDQPELWRDLTNWLETAWDDVPPAPAPGPLAAPSAAP